MAHRRVFVLAAAAALNWGAYFIYDIPASMSTSLSEHLSLPELQFAYLVSLLYIVYAVPNTALPFFSGAAVQRFGERIVLLATISSIIIGQLLFAVAVHTKLQHGMIVGRALIGLGGEVVGVLGCEIITRCGLSLALAINLGAGRLGSVANTIVIPRLVGPYGIVSATWIATALSLGVATIGVVSLLSIAKPAVHENLAMDGASSNFLAPLPFHQFPPVFWHLALMCLLSYGCLNTFTNSSQRFLAVRFYNGDQRAAGSAMSNAFLILAHAVFLTDTLPGPILPLCLLGTADALLGVSFWASVVRCLLEAEPHTHAHAHIRVPLLRNRSSRDRSVYDSREPMTVFPYPKSIEEEEEGEYGNITADTEPHPITRAEAVRTLGLGIMTSLMNISTAVVPVPLALMENLAGLEGLEGVFLVLAGLGFLVAVRLAFMAM
ncbi:hypothetical protein BJX76DRAFT_352755 [Aspergillus varians]